MVLRRMAPEIYRSLESLRTTSIKGFIESPILVDGKSKISEVVGTLMKNNAYLAFMQLKNKITGISVRDILAQRSLTAVKPSTIGKAIPLLASNSTLGTAAGIMSHYRLRTLPVVEDGEIIGQIRSSSIIKKFGDLNLAIAASDIMTPKPIMMRTEDKGATARNVMLKQNIDHLPVVSGKKIAGMLTSMHLLNVIAPSERPQTLSAGAKGAIRGMNFPVIGIADKDVIKSNIDEKLNVLTKTIVDTGSSYSLVTLDEEVQGIITHTDLVALLQEMIEEEFPVYIMGLPDDPAEAELAKSKFLSVLMLLKKVTPEILESRCNIKVKDAQGERRRYEVDVHVITPKDRLTYTDTGWDLARIFDRVSDALKKNLSRSQEKRRSKTKRRSSIRYKTDTE